MDRIDPAQAEPLKGLSCLDDGCGGGIFTEVSLSAVRSLILSLCCVASMTLCISALCAVKCSAIEHTI